ncbi:MAG TPA: helix-turn-helix domain-containing protein [Gaiellaceae bacterium]|jgi:excisionase family DNA binding protein
MTVREVAQQSKFGEKAVRKAIHCGELRASKLRGQWRVSETDYEAWVESGRVVVLPVAVVVAPAVPTARGSLAVLRRIEGETAA